LELKINLLSISFFIIALTLLYLSIKIVEFLASLKNNITELQTSVVSSLKNIEGLITKIEPVIVSLESVEKNVNTTLIDIQSKTENIKPLLIEVTNVSKTYNDLGRNINNNLNSQLPQILTNANNVTKDINDMSLFIKHKVSDTEEIFDEANKRALHIIKLSDTVIQSLQGLAIQVSSMATGLKGSLEFLTETIFNNKGGK
jgi:uncharacterized protein YoxC